VGLAVGRSSPQVERAGKVLAVVLDVADDEVNSISQQNGDDGGPGFCNVRPAGRMLFSFLIFDHCLTSRQLFYQA